MRIGYLCNLYPGISSTFITREVVALRGRGVEIDTLSIRRASGPHVLAPLHRREAATTFSVLPPTPSRLVGSHLRALAASPLRYLGALATAVRMSRPGARGLLWGMFYFAEAGIVWDECRRRGLRHLHVHFGNVACDVALLATCLGPRGDARTPRTFSFTVHGPTEFFELSENRLEEKARRAALVVCISNFARSQLMSITDYDEWEKLRIVHCGIDPDVFAPVERVRRSGEPLRILCVGRLVAVKGQAVLLEALADLRRRGMAVHLTLVGDGPSRAALERRATQLGLGEHVTFTGPMGDDRMPGFYADADVFCLPTFAEGLPIVLMEAMATELPVVTTPVAGIPELVEDRVTGRIVAPSDAGQLADALEELGREPELARRLGVAGREKVLAEFDIRDAAAELERLFGGLAGDRT
jgi:colanic acid/amylovoran biosynthesis glycosyltransferase